MSTVGDIITKTRQLINFSESNHLSRDRIGTYLDIVDSKIRLRIPRIDDSEQTITLTMTSESTPLPSGVTIKRILGMSTGDGKEVKVLTKPQFNDAKSSSTGGATLVSIWDGVVYVKPTPTTGGPLTLNLEVVAWLEALDTLSNDSSTILTTKYGVLYQMGLARELCLHVKELPDEASIWEGEFEKYLRDVSYQEAQKLLSRSL